MLMLAAGHRSVGVTRVRQNSQELKENCGHWPGNGESLITQQKWSDAYNFVQYIIKSFPMPNLYIDESRTKCQKSLTIALYVVDKVIFSKKYMYLGVERFKNHQRTVITSLLL